METPTNTPVWKKYKLGLLISLSALGIGLITLVAAAIYIYQLDVTKLSDTLPEPTYIIDRHGQKASQLSSSKIEPVAFDHIPLNLRNAVIATEDQRFYKHKGVDVRSIGRALWRDLKEGSYVEGGSTITQQLAKNLFLPSDKSMSRKLREAAFALKIDITYNKDQILELYLNRIYFGEGSWGVQRASKKYFAKEVTDLSLEEAALLAALPKAPSNYSPFKNKEGAMERRNLVLSLMMEQGYIEELAYQTAIAKPIVLSNSHADELKGSYASYVDYVIEEAINKYGLTEDHLLSAGLLIYTELDPKVQNAIQDVYADNQYFPKSKPDQLLQSGGVLLDQTTGGIRALMGYRGEGVFRGFNHASQLRRQPGSSFKPIAVYGPALEQGYAPDSTLYDGPLDINGYSPQDWDLKTRGNVTMMEAVVQSWNIPAVWLLNEIGIGTGMDFVKKLGVPLDEKADRTLGTALGGLSTGVSPLHMAQAFSAFANLGVMHEAHVITKITTSSGKVLVEATQQPTQTMRPETAYTLTLMMQEATARGTGQHAALNRPTAGKTGTTQLPDTTTFAGLPSGSAKDAWFVGYTPELTAAIWVGYDQTDREHYLTTADTKASGNLFREILTRSLLDVPATNFVMPKGFSLPSAQTKDEIKQTDKEKTEKDKDQKKNKEKEKEKKEKEKEKLRKEKQKEEREKKEEKERDKEQEKRDEEPQEKKQRENRQTEKDQ
ncbi:Penicillin-binding protein 1F [compost metagenome]